MTHGAISRQVRALEAWLETPLFDRNGRRVTPNEAGRRYQTDLQRAFDNIADATDRVRAAGKVQQLVVDALPTFAMRWLLPRLAQFQQRFPHVQLRLLSSDAKLHPASGGFDVAVRRGPITLKGCNTKLFLREYEVPVCSPALLRRRRIKSPEDLQHHTLLYADTRPNAWARWLTQAEVPNLVPRARQHFDHFYLALQAAIDGLGVALGPLPIINDELLRGSLVAPLRGPRTRAQGYCWVVPERSASRIEVAAFCSWLDEGGARAAEVPDIPNRATSRSMRSPISTRKH